MVELNTINVLLVEDDQNVRMTIKSMLQEMGVQNIYEARDGQAALQFFGEREGDVSLVICDWNMPNKTGIEFLREVRQVRPELPFLMVTARADQASVVSARDAHVTAYIRKPFTYEDLRAKVSSIF